MGWRRLVGKGERRRNGDGDNHPFFSVIVPTFNRSRFIVPTIESALWQTYPHFEVLVIGDGCTDDTETVLKENFAARVSWHNLASNHGSQSYPNNEGIKRAKGSHVAYLGHDDIWAPEHLAMLARVIKRHDPDFAVSGAIYHKPPGAGAPHVTGLVVNPVPAARHFYPPTSFAHRCGALDRLGGWPNPNSVSAPVDCHLILSARQQGMTFASTEAITVHKFAAGHRYLSYLFPSDEEQKRMMKALGKRAGENRILTRLIADAMTGLTPTFSLMSPMENSPPGDLHRLGRERRGLEIGRPTDLKMLQEFVPDDGNGALDWHSLEHDPARGPFRWSGPNPNPIWFLNIRCPGSVSFVVHILDFANPSHAEKLRIEANDETVALDMEQGRDHFRFTGNSPDGPIADGLKLRFRLPSSVRLADGRRVGFRLHRIDVAPRPGAPSFSTSENAQAARGL